MAVQSISGPKGIPGFTFSDQSNRPAKMFAAPKGVYDFGRANNIRQVHIISGDMQLNGAGMSANLPRGVNVEPDEEFCVAVLGSRDAVFAIYDF